MQWVMAPLAIYVGVMEKVEGQMTLKTKVNIFGFLKTFCSIFISIFTSIFTDIHYYIDLVL